jgi:hypothetical protein
MSKLLETGPPNSKSKEIIANALAARGSLPVRMRDRSNDISPPRCQFNDGKSMDIKTVSHNLYRGRRPLSPTELEQLRGLGITKIICLQEGWSWLFGGFKAQDLWENLLGPGSYLTFSFSNFFPPTRDDTLAILREINESIIDGHVVYLHCRIGKDRTGWISAMHLKKHGRLTAAGAWLNAGINGMNKHYRLFWKRAFFRVAGQL